MDEQGRASEDFILRASQWLHGHDTGLSSEAIFDYMTLGVKEGYAPADPADLGRCIRLLERFPEWKPRMVEMVNVSADWARLMPHWDKVVSLFHREAGQALYDRWGSWSAPETYDLMHNIFYERDAEGALRRRAEPASSEGNT